jgi:hypothetical protein
LDLRCRFGNICVERYAYITHINSGFAFLGIEFRGKNKQVSQKRLNKSINQIHQLSKTKSGFLKFIDELNSYLLGQYFPKGMSFVDIARKDVIEAVHKLNSRPRKCLNYATPYEVFRELTGIDAIILVKGIRL